MINFAKIESDPKFRANVVAVLNKGMVVAGTAFVALLGYLCATIF